MSFEVTAQVQNELIDVAEALYGSFGTVTPEGFLIQQSWPGGVKIIDVAGNTEERVISSDDYVVEFMKICGRDLNDVDHDELKVVCSYVAEILDMTNHGFAQFDTLRPIHQAVIDSRQAERTAFHREHLRYQLSGLGDYYRER